MRVPIVCVDARLRQYAQTFADCFNRPQFQHFVIVLVGLLLVILAVNLPWIGTLINFLLILLGLGAIALSVYRNVARRHAPAF